MKNLIKILVIALVILSGCKTVKKVTESTVSKSNEKIEINTSVLEKNDLSVQNDVSSDLQTTTEETVTEFYAPGSTGSTSSPTGAVKSIKTTKTTTKKKDADNSIITDKGQKQENSQQKKEGETEVRSQKKEAIKKGVAQWKVIVFGIALVSVGVLYVLIRKKVIEIPLLTKLLKWLKSLF